MVEGHAAQWRWWQKGLLWEVRVVQVPDVGLPWHILWHLLEPEHGVGNTDSQLSNLWVPSDASGRSLEVIWVLEDHLGLGGDGLREMLGLLSSKVLLEQIDDVVLLDATSGSSDHLLGGLRETKGGISVHLLGVLSLISWLSMVNLTGPSCKILV